MVANPPSSIRRVLVCDDERHLVRLIQVNLQRQGYEVGGVYGGREAIERLERETFDMAVLDVEMPGLSGLDVLRWIRSNERTRGIRVVLLGPPDEGDGPYEADLYLTKPFNPTGLFK